MDIKRISVSIAVLSIFVSGPTLSQESTNNGFLSSVISLLLDSDNENSIELVTDGEPVRFPLSGINTDNIEQCSISPELPTGLTIEVSADLSNCEIVGVPSETIDTTEFIVVAENSFNETSTIPITLNIDLELVTLSGRATYDRVPASISNGLDYDNIRQEPIRGGVVELLDSSGLVLQTTSTNDDGQYVFSIRNNQALRVRIQAAVRRNASNGGVQYDVEIVDNTNFDALYFLTEAQTSTIANNPVRNLQAESGWNPDVLSYTGTRASGPFAILDSIYESITDVIAVDANVVFPALTVNWSINNSLSGPLAGESTADARGAGRIGTSFYVPSNFDLDAGELFILGAENSDTDEFDDHVVIHEWGHYFEDRLSRSDSIGGSHAVGDRLDLRLAFSEGFSNALSGIITEDPIYADTFGFFQLFTFGFDLENNDIENEGWYSEGTIQSIIYDVFDNERDGFDSISLGLAPIYNAMVGDHAQTEAFTSIYSFATALINESPNAERDIENLLFFRSISSLNLNDFGSSESNAANLSRLDFLPIYSPVGITTDNVDFTDAVNANVCISTEFIEADQTVNKLFNSAFVTVDIPSDGDYSIAVLEDVPSVEYDETQPTILVYQGGEFITGAFAFTAGSASVRSNLTAGVNTIEVRDENIQANPGFEGQACFDVFVIQN